MVAAAMCAAEAKGHRVTGFEGFEQHAAAARRAVIVANDPLAVADAQAAVRHAGVAVTATIFFANLTTALDDITHADLLVVDATGVPVETLDGALPVLAARAERDRAQLVVSFGVEAIDVVSLHLLGGPATLLCEARPEERVAAIVLGSGTKAGFNAAERDAERLQRLNAEVARIAEALAKLARDGDTGEGVRDRTDDFVAPDTGDGPVPTVSAATVRGAIRARRLREQFFASDLFADPAWDMLLDLFAARLEGGNVSVSSLCIASAVPPTTALRWITTLTDAGLVARQEDPADKRRAFIVLTARGVAGMQGYAEAVARAGLGWA